MLSCRALEHSIDIHPSACKLRLKSELDKMMILFVICPKVLPPLCYGTTQLQRQPPVSLARLRNQEDRGHQLVDIGAFNTIMSKLPVFALCRDYRPHPL